MIKYVYMLRKKRSKLGTLEGINKFLKEHNAKYGSDFFFAPLPLSKLLNVKDINFLWKLLKPYSKTKISDAVLINFLTDLGKTIQTYKDDEDEDEDEEDEEDEHEEDEEPDDLRDDASLGFDESPQATIAYYATNFMTNVPGHSLPIKLEKFHNIVERELERDLRAFHRSSDWSSEDFLQALDNGSFMVIRVDAYGNARCEGEDIQAFGSKMSFEDGEDTILECTYCEHYLPTWDAFHAHLHFNHNIVSMFPEAKPDIQETELFSKYEVEKVYIQNQSPVKLPFKTEEQIYILNSQVRRRGLQPLMNQINFEKSTGMFLNPNVWRDVDSRAKLLPDEHGKFYITTEERANYHKIFLQAKKLAHQQYLDNLGEDEDEDNDDEKQMELDELDEEAETPQHNDDDEDDDEDVLDGDEPLTPRLHLPADRSPSPPQTHQSNK